MPTFIRPAWVHVETGSGAGVGIGVAVVAGGGGAWWLADRIAEYAAAIEAGVGVTAVAATVFTVWFVRRECRRVLVFHDPAAAAEVAAQKRAAAAPQPQVVHYHQHDETHYHWHSAPQITVTAPAPAVPPPAVAPAPERQAIAPRKVIPGVVLNDRRPAIREKQ